MLLLLLLLLLLQGDNPTAGGVGDTPSMIGALIKQGVPDAVVQGPVDAVAVARCLDAGKGATVELSIGGKLDYVNAAPLSVTGVVRYACKTPQTYTVNVNAGTSNPPLSRTCTMPAAAVVAVQTSAAGPGGGGTILVTLTAGRKPFHFEKDFQLLGTEPSAYAHMCPLREKWGKRGRGGEGERGNDAVV